LTIHYKQRLRTDFIVVSCGAEHSAFAITARDRRHGFAQPKAAFIIERGGVLRISGRPYYARTTLLPGGTWLPKGPRAAILTMQRRAVLIELPAGIAPAPDMGEDDHGDETEVDAKPQNKRKPKPEAAPLDVTDAQLETLADLLRELRGIYPSAVICGLDDLLPPDTIDALLDVPEFCDAYGIDSRIGTLPPRPMHNPEAAA
jgi:hypothetical protein